MPSETETPSGVTPTGTTPSELGDLGGGSGVTGGTSIGSIGGGGGSNGVYTPPGPTGGNTTEEPFSPPDSNGGTISTDTSGPVDDNLSGDTTDPIALEHSLTGSAAKDYLGDIAGGDIDTSELENRIRTQQVAGGLGYGGASAKQEAKIVGQYKQSERLRASEQLASLSEAESKTSTQTGKLVGQAQQDTMVASTSQLTTPVQVYESILGGSMSGLNSVFGLGGLL